MTGADLASFAEHLRSLHAAGVPLARGLESLGRDAGGGPLGRAARAVAASIAEGRPLGAALAALPGEFPDSFVAAVAAGERSGRLGEVLEVHAAHLLREEELGREVRSATRYPTFVLVYCSVAVVALFGYAPPAVREAYAAVGGTPPAFTAALFRSGDFVDRAWPALVSGAALLVFLAALALGSEAGAAAMGRVLLRAPVLRLLFGKPEVARFAGSLAVLRRAGIPLPEAFGLAGRAQRNPALRAESLRIAGGIERGGDPAGLLLGSRLLPRSLGEAAAAAAAGADLGTALDAVARRLENEVRHDLRRVGTAVGPAVLGLAAVVVLALILSVDMTLIDRLRAMSLTGN